MKKLIVLLLSAALCASAGFLLIKILGGKSKSIRYFMVSEKPIEI